MTEAESIRNAMKFKPKKSADSTIFLSSGSTVLNMACSGKSFGAFRCGSYCHLIGDSDSGKTWLSMTCLAEASIDKRFDDYKFVYYGPEFGAKMDIERYFGPRVKKRLEFREVEFLEDFYYDLEDTILEPSIVICDSLDALRTRMEEKKFHENKKASQKGREEKGSMTDGKAKINSACLRRIPTPLKASNSILILISQSRDNIGTFSFEDKTRSGGTSLKFFADFELWSTVKSKLKTQSKVNDKFRQTGIMSRIRIKKNRITGKDRTVEFPIYHSVGIDNVGGCITYLLMESHWKKGKGIIKAEELDFSGSESELVAHIEENNLEKDLQKVVSKVWRSIEEKCKVERKFRYG